LIDVPRENALCKNILRMSVRKGEFFGWLNLSNLCHGDIRRLVICEHRHEMKDHQQSFPRPFPLLLALAVASVPHRNFGHPFAHVQVVECH